MRWQVGHCFIDECAHECKHPLSTKFSCRIVMEDPLRVREITRRVSKQSRLRFIDPNMTPPRFSRWYFNFAERNRTREPGSCEVEVPPAKSSWCRGSAGPIRSCEIELPPAKAWWCLFCLPNEQVAFRNSANMLRSVSITNLHEFIPVAVNPNKPVHVQ